MLVGCGGHRSSFQEIVVFGPIIRLVFADSEHAEMVASLVALGVRFDGCLNTVNSIEHETGQKPDLSPNMIPVRASVARILDLVDQGYTLVRR